MSLRGIVRALVALVLAVAVVGGTGTAALADNTVPPPGTWVEIWPPFFNQSAHKCLDNTNGSNNVDNPVQVYHCHGYDNKGAPQRWQLFNRSDDPANNPYYEIRNVGTNQCLYALNLGVVQEPCNLQFRGLWRIIPTPNVGPYFALSNLGFFGGCMATSDSSGGDHARAIIATCNYDNQNDPTWTRQVWSFG